MASSGDECRVVSANVESCDKDGQRGGLQACEQDVHPATGTVASLQDLWREMHAVCKLDTGKSDAVLARAVVRAVAGSTRTRRDVHHTETIESATDERPHHVLRLEANMTFERGDHVGAASAYGKVLITACHQRADRVDIATIFLNRATALLRCGQFEDALSDCKAACALDESNPKAWIRKAECVIACASHGCESRDLESCRADVDACIERARRAARVRGTERAVNLKIASLDVGALGSPLFNNKDTTPLHHHHDQRRREHTKGSPLSMVYVESQRVGVGRYVEASQDIETGTEVVVEPPVAAVVSDEAATTRCHGCFKALPLSFRPCMECGWALYCSEQCDVDTRDTHAQVECGRPPLECESRLALRLACMEPPWSDDLVSNIHLFDSDHLSRCASTAISVANRLHSKANTQSSEQNAVRLLVWLCRLRMNAVAVTAYRRDSSSIEHVRVALGLFRSTAALNHSCNPNLQLSFRMGTTVQLVARARRAIRKGTELSISYGPHVGFSLAADRQTQLMAHYCFACHCEACDAETVEASAYSLPSDVAHAVAALREYRDKRTITPAQLAVIVSAGDSVWSASKTVAPQAEIFSSFDVVARAAVKCEQYKLASLWLSRAVAALEGLFNACLRQRASEI